MTIETFSITKLAHFAPTILEECELILKWLKDTGQGGNTVGASHLRYVIEMLKDAGVGSYPVPVEAQDFELDPDIEHDK